MAWHTQLKRNSIKRVSLLVPGITSKEKPQTEGQPANQLTDLLRLYWQQYCEKSSIHGVRYIYDPTLRYIERLIWTTLVMTCVTLTCIAYFMLAERYSSQKLQTVVENSQYPVFQIPFPAIAVCTTNRINWLKFEQAKKKFLLPNAEQNEIDIFTTFVSRMESMKFGHFDAFADMADINLELLDGIDIAELTKFMSFTCEEIFVNGSCRWRRAPIDCCSYFVNEHTELGMCLVFNSILSPDSLIIENKIGKNYYPLHNSKAGQGSGLNFAVQMNYTMLRPNTTVENAVTILVKRPEQLFANGYTITPGTQTYVIVRPEITTSDKDIRPLSYEKRNCFFENENVLLYYHKTAGIDKDLMLSNCLNACHEEHMRKYCNCTLPIFFLSNDTSVETCRASQFRCLAKHNDIFSYDKRLEEDAYFSLSQPGMACSCLVPCNIVEYYTALSTIPLDDEELCNKTGIDTYQVDVHYQSEVIIQYRTSLEFTSIDLIANFGGVFGLCLGASMVSAVELLYYLTFGLGLYLYDNNYYKRFRQKLRNLKSQLKKCFYEDYDDADHVKHKSSFFGKHPHRKDNQW